MENKNMNNAEKQPSKIKQFFHHMAVSSGKAIDHFSSIDQAYSKRPRKWIANLITFLIIAGLVVYFALDVNMQDPMRAPNWKSFGNMLNGFLHLDWSYFFGYGDFSFKTSVIYQIIETFAIALVGTTIASIISIPFGFLGSRKLVGNWAIISELILILIRTFPEILFGYIMIKVVGFGPAAGVVVLSVHSVGMIGKMYSEQLDLIDDGPLEALDSCGASWSVKLKLGVVPQVAPNFLSVILYRFDLNIRTASVLGLVGAGGIGYPIMTNSSNQHWSLLGSVLLGVLLLVFLVDFISSRIRKKLI